MGVSPMFAVLRNLAGTPDKQQERSDLQLVRAKDRFALAYSIGVPIEIEGYLEHGQDAHDT
jgi:hypothetical protein